MTQTETPDTPTYTHKEILQAMSGLLLAIFVAMLSSTVVTNALPRIVSDLHGTQTAYTWVIVSTMLAMTATTPIWGKLADLFSKKLLMQTAMVIYIAGSALAGLSHSMGMLIGARVLTGLGAGGVMSLMQIIIGSLVSPRERGRYAGYTGAAFGLATLLGPLVGGLVVDSPMGWRGCFYIGIPFAIAAFYLMQRHIHLPFTKRPVKIDYLGSFLLMAGVSTILIWVTLAGNDFDWISYTSLWMVLGGLALLAVALVVEVRYAAEPVIPVTLFRNPSISLATVATVFVGVAMFGATTFLSEYFQTARGMSPTAAGLMSLAQVGGLMLTSIVSGRMISNTGRWKVWLVGGMGTVVLGSALLATMDHRTSLWLIGLYMAILGAGLGATQQNLILSVQNNVSQAVIGSATSVVNFFRSLGGAIGVAALGAVLSTRVTHVVGEGLPGLLASGAVSQDELAPLENSDVPDMSTLSDPLRELFAGAFGDATGHIFLFSVPCAVVALICVWFIRETRLRTTLDKLENPELEPELAAELEIAELGQHRR